ncbi:MAG: PA14 domain-containing protein, partial [Phormidium sp.]
IQGSIGSFYNSNPNIARDLGQSTGNEFQFVSGKWRQNFQGGAIFHSSNGTFSVHGSLGKYYLNIGGQNSQVGLPTGEEVHIGNGNWQQNFEKGFIEFLNNGTAQVILTPASDWRAEYFNNINLTGKPVFLENLGRGSRGFSRSWGNGSPTNTPSDNFSARMTTQRYLAPGLYKITTQADDGIRVRIGNQTVVNRWVDQPYTTNSGYFYSNGGDFPVAVEYYERGGSAAINYNIAPATKFRDPVNESQQWKATVYNWDSSQRSAPPIDFWQGDINNSKAIGEINLGSNTRSDGKKGINVNWGNGAPNGDGNRLPHDNFAMRAYTWADFDGSPYKFRVMGDDGFQILAKNQATGQWSYITSQNSWDQAYGPQKEITHTLPAGRYDLHFHQYEAGGDAYLNLDWEKVGNPDIDIQLFYPNGGFTQSQMNQMEKAAQNWERLITKDKDSSGVLKIAVTKTSNYGIDGTLWRTDWAEAHQDNAVNSRTNFYLQGIDNPAAGIDYQGRINFNSAILSDNNWVNNWLVKTTMHEMGHTLGLGHEGTAYSMMADKEPKPYITDTSYNKLSTLGYNFDRNATVYWS